MTILDGALERHVVPTALGDIWLSGRDSGKPILLAMPGLYSNPDFGVGMQTWWPGTDVFVGRLPGDGPPELAATSVGAFAAAYSEALAKRFPARPIFAFGISAGALLALALRGVDLRGLLLIEPPLRTEALWPLRDALRDVGPTGWERLAWPLFGIDGTRHEARDYTPLLDALRVPAAVLIGEQSLMPRRPLDEQPSLLDDESIKLLEANLLVNLVKVHRAGHAVMSRDPELVERHLRECCAKALGADAARRSD